VNYDRDIVLTKTSFLPEKMKGKQEPLEKFKAVNNGPAAPPEHGLANDGKIFTGYICVTAPQWFWCPIHRMRNWICMREYFNRRQKVCRIF
jgi:hypothetical protein